MNFGEYNLQHTLAEFNAVEAYMNLSRLTAYELGNEPDFYSTIRQFRPVTWNVFDYAQQTASWLSQITASLRSNQTRNFPGYIYGSLANFPAEQGNFSLGSLIKMGINDAVEDIKIFSHHCYFGDVCTRKFPLSSIFELLLMILSGLQRKMQLWCLYQYF